MSVTLNFGDGTPQRSAELDQPVEHDYGRTGNFGISASDSTGHRGTAHVTGPGKYRITVHAKDDGGGEDGPAEPTLTIPDLTLKAGDSDVDRTTRLVNQKGRSTGVTGRIVVKGAVGAGLTVGDLTMTQPGFENEKPSDTRWAVDNDDLVGTYPEAGLAFEIYPDMDAEGHNTWSLSGTPTAGDLEVTTTLSADGKELTSVDWKLTVDDDDGGGSPPERTVTAVDPSDTVAAGATLTITGAGLTGVTASALGYKQGGEDYSQPATDVTVVNDTTVTVTVPATLINKEIIELHVSTGVSNTAGLDLADSPITVTAS